MPTDEDGNEMCCDECGHPPAKGNVVYCDSGRRPLCETCNGIRARKTALAAAQAAVVKAAMDAWNALERRDRDEEFDPAVMARLEMERDAACADLKKLGG